MQLSRRDKNTLIFQPDITQPGTGLSSEDFAQAVLFLQVATAESFGGACDIVQECRMRLNNGSVKKVSPDNLEIRTDFNECSVVKFNISVRSLKDQDVLAEAELTKIDDQLVARFGGKVSYSDRKKTFGHKIMRAVEAMYE